MGDELEWRRRRWRSSSTGASGRSTGRWTSCASGRCRCSSRVRMGLAVLLLQKRAHEAAPFESITAREWIESRDGPRAVAQDLGAVAARQVRRARRRHLDGVAVEQAHAAPPARGRRGAPGAARLPEALVGAVVRRAARRDRGRRRARADRPPGGGAAARRRAVRGRRGRARARFARGHDPRAFARAGRAAERYDAVVATVPNDVFLGLLDDDLAAAIGDAVPRPPAHDRVPHRALPAARARPPLLAVLLDEHRRHDDPVRRPDRAHELHRPEALRRPALPLRRQLPRARRPAARARRGRAARRVHARPARGPARRSRATGSASAGCTASPPPSRSSRSATTSASRRCRPASRTSSSRTRRRSIPRTAARTTPCASAATPRARCSRAT